VTADLAPIRPVEPRTTQRAEPTGGQQGPDEAAPPADTPAAPATDAKDSINGLLSGGDPQATGDGAASDSREGSASASGTSGSASAEAGDAQPTASSSSSDSSSASGTGNGSPTASD
jgi:hypothetical protein